MPFFTIKKAMILHTPGSSADSGSMNSPTEPSTASPQTERLKEPPASVWTGLSDSAGILRSTLIRITILCSTFLKRTVSHGVGSSSRRTEAKELLSRRPDSDLAVPERPAQHPFFHCSFLISSCRAAMNTNNRIRSEYAAFIGIASGLEPR